MNTLYLGDCLPGFVQLKPDFAVTGTFCRISKGFYK
jgi:hypothetical protein